MEGSRDHHVPWNGNYEIHRTHDFKIDKNKMTLILNKTTNFEVDECVYRENLGNLEVKGRLRYNEQMELIMNKNDLDRRLVWLEN